MGRKKISLRLKRILKPVGYNIFTLHFTYCGHCFFRLCLLLKYSEKNLLFSKWKCRFFSGLDYSSNTLSLSMSISCHGDSFSCGIVKRNIPTPDTYFAAFIYFIGSTLNFYDDI